MKIIFIVGILLIALLLSVENSSAWSGNNTILRSRGNSPTESEDFFIKHNILNGVVKPIDYHKFGQAIFDALKNSSKQVAQIDAQSGNQTTYKEMLDRSIRLTLWMKKQGVTSNDIVVLCTHNHLDSDIPLFATFFAGAIFSGWNYDLTLDTAQRLTNQFSPKLIFTNEKAADVLVEAATLESSNATLIVFGEHLKLLKLSDIMDAQTQDEVNNFALVNEKSLQDVAAIMLTSGSTAFPKGVMLPNQFQIESSAQNSRCIWYSTLDWISGFLYTVRAITEKIIRIIPESEDIDSFFQVIEKYKVNCVLKPPASLNKLVKSGLARKYNLRSLKTIFISGSKVSKGILSSLQHQLPTVFIRQRYGTTEVGLIATTTTRSKHIDSAGIIAPNCKVKIVDIHSGKNLGPNKNGELHVKTPSMMIGYYKNPIKTKESVDAEGWFRTGDFGYYDESGEIFIVARINEIIRFNNYDIYPAEIEEILTSHPRVLEVFVVPVSIGFENHRPVAFITKALGSNVTKDELMKLTSVLEDYKKLKEIYFVDKMPGLQNGKIAKLKLKELAKNFTENDKKS